MQLESGRISYLAPNANEEMSINRTIVHTWQADVTKGDRVTRQEHVLAKTIKEARKKLQKTHNTKVIKNLKRVS